MPIKTKQLLIFAAAMACMAAPAQAAPVFSDNFETPDATTYTVANTSQLANGTKWVRAVQGFNANRNGIVDESENSGANFQDPAGSQAYGFRYSSNTGLTSAAGVIGALTAGQTYTVTIDVVTDGFDGGDAYSFALVTFNGAARDDVRSNAGATATLATAAGNVGGATAYQPITFNYTATGAEATLGQDVALRVFGSSGNGGIIDNVTVTVVPEPASLALLGLSGLALLRRRAEH